jgi:hypothetical protein
MREYLRRSRPKLNLRRIPAAQRRRRLISQNNCGLQPAFRCPACLLHFGTRAEARNYFRGLLSVVRSASATPTAVAAVAASRLSVRFPCRSGKGAGLRRTGE